MRSGAWLAGIVLLSSLPAFAVDADRAREELERELRELVSIPPSRVVIEFEPLDEPNFRLEAANFMLDGRTIEVPSIDALNREGVHRVFAGELPEGRHELITRVTYVDASSVVLSAQAGFKWKVSSAVRFEVRDGLEVTVRANPQRDASEPELRKQIGVKHTQKVGMLAKVDTSIPPPPPKPKVVLADAEPAGPIAATAEPEPVKAATAAPDETLKTPPERSRGKRRSREQIVPAKAKVATAKAKATTRKTRSWAPKSLTPSEPEAAPAPTGETVAAAFVAAPPPSPEVEQPEPVVAPEPAPEPNDTAVEAPATPAAPENDQMAQYVLFAGGGLVVLALIAVVARRRKAPSVPRE